MILVFKQEPYVKECNQIASAILFVYYQGFKNVILVVSISINIDGSKLMKPG